MYRYACNHCGYYEDDEQKRNSIPRCPKCVDAWRSLYRKKLKPKKLKLDHIGFCARCGKSVGVGSGEIVDGVFYGPECVKRFK